MCLCGEAVTDRFSSQRSSLLWQGWDAWESQSPLSFKYLLGKVAWNGKSRAEPWIFKGTLGTFQFGLSSLGAQDTKEPTIEVNSIVSFGLCCLTSQSSKSICTTFIILKSFLCLFPPCFFSPISDSKLFKRMHWLILSVQLSTSFLWLYTRGTLLKCLISSLSIVCFHIEPISHS